MQLNDNSAQPPRINWRLVGLVFVLATGLRVSLAIVNREANDNHYEVVELILEGRTGLTMADCHECFHPKLFYYVCAAVVRVCGLTSEATRTQAGQLLDVSLGGLVARPTNDQWPCDRAAATHIGMDAVVCTSEFCAIRAASAVLADYRSQCAAGC